MSRDLERRTLPRGPPSRRSIATLFAIGGIMLVLPLVLVFATNAPCTSESGSVCSTAAYKFGVSFFPYVMVAGGLIIGYNMKRVSDSLRPPESSLDSEARSDD